MSLAPATGYADHPVVDEGDGPAVVFLHGAPDHRTEWDEVIVRLREGYRCLAPDLPGFGDAGPPPIGYDFSIDAQVRWFDAWLTEIVGDAPITLVAHDIGAIMGAAWATMHPERVRQLVVMSTILWSGHLWRGIPRVWGSRVLGPLFMAILNRPAYRLAFRKDFPTVPPHQADRMYRGLSPTARRSLLRHFRAMTAPDYFQAWESRLATVHEKVPLTVLWGADDPLLSMSDAARFGVASTILEACSHWIPLERPWAVAAAVEALGAET